MRRNQQIYVETCGAAPDPWRFQIHLFKQSKYKHHGNVQPQWQFGQKDVFPAIKQEMPLEFGMSNCNSGNDHLEYSISQAYNSSLESLSFLISPDLKVMHDIFSAVFVAW